jgi:hypothetical protein
MRRMMKLEITLPSGLRLAFEGERSDLDHTAGLLNLADVVTTGRNAPPAPPELNPGGDGSASAKTLDPNALSKRLDQVNAKNHIQRVTVMAQAAIEAGMEGLDFATVESLYKSIGIPKPGSWKATFSNARTAGQVQNVGRGLWKPTIQGENYALYGNEG